ncbi:hypothetical protein B0H10DRAFT_2318779 [Mycena sp. CBHHK59/15]|nr:hypothetical protein B0H10DRAFT_2318779 [Mycena sp. CBHHK59/15]
MGTHQSEVLPQIKPLLSAKISAFWAHGRPAKWSCLPVPAHARTAREPTSRPPVDFVHLSIASRHFYGSTTQLSQRNIHTQASTTMRSTAGTQDLNAPPNHKSGLPDSAHTTIRLAPRLLCECRVIHRKDAAQRHGHSRVCTAASLCWSNEPSRQRPTLERAPQTRAHGSSWLADAPLSKRRIEPKEMRGSKAMPEEIVGCSDRRSGVKRSCELGDASVDACSGARKQVTRVGMAGAGEDDEAAWWPGARVCGVMEEQRAGFLLAMHYSARVDRADEGQRTVGGRLEDGVSYSSSARAACGRALLSNTTDMRDSNMRTAKRHAGGPVGEGQLGEQIAIGGQGAADLLSIVGPSGQTWFLQ